VLKNFWKRSKNLTTHTGGGNTFRSHGKPSRLSRNVCRSMHLSFRRMVELRTRGRESRLVKLDRCLEQPSFRREYSSDSLLALACTALPATWPGARRIKEYRTRWFGCRIRRRLGLYTVKVHGYSFWHVSGDKLLCEPMTAIGLSLLTSIKWKWISRLLQRCEPSARGSSVGLSR
jgi:hypothetical protein